MSDARLTRTTRIIELLDEKKVLLDFIKDFAHGRPNATQRAAEDLLVGLGYEGLTTHVTKELDNE